MKKTGDHQRDEHGREVTMTVDPMHDEAWTRRLLAGPANELDNLATVIPAAADRGEDFSEERRS